MAVPLHKKHSTTVNKKNVLKFRTFFYMELWAPTLVGDFTNELQSI